MEFVKLKIYVENLDSLLRQECTGTAKEFSIKLGVSERTLQYHIQQLREIGINIIYDVNKKTYKYSEIGRLAFGFNHEEMKRIKGGGLSIIHLPSTVLLNFE